MNGKPPIGVEPERLWVEERSRELAKAIGRYACPDDHGYVHLEKPCVRVWLEELERHLQWLRDHPQPPFAGELASRLYGQ